MMPLRSIERPSTGHVRVEREGDRIRILAETSDGAYAFIHRLTVKQAVDLVRGLTETVSQIRYEKLAPARPWEAMN